MSNISAENQEKFIQRVKESLKKAEQHASRQRKLHARLLILGVVNSGASTLVTGVTAARGPLVGEDIAGWQLACIIAAVLGFAATVSVGLHQQLGLGERVAKADLCVGKLRSLDLALATSSRDWVEMTKEYGEILRHYAEVL